jgi:rare lipoprotein A
VVLAAAIGLTACALLPPGPPAQPHAVVGAPYQIRGIWFYPRERFHFTTTGLAVVSTKTGGLTADGERYDPEALAGANRTLQLPAFVRVTNLENGRALVVRLNDRGPDDPGRLIALTPRAARLLGMGSAPVRVRMQVLEDRSRELMASLTAPPLLPLAAAPRGAVGQESLAPPDGVRQVRPRPVPAIPTVGATPALASGNTPSFVPSGVVEQEAPDPGRLFVQCGRFSALAYASVMQARLAGLGAHVAIDDSAPPDAAYQVRIGPFQSTAAADAALDRALRAGVSDARIVVATRTQP